MTEAQLRRALSALRSADEGAPGGVPTAETGAARRGDHDLNRDLAPDPAVPLRPAAVLVPIVLHREAPSILLTQRTPHLHAHAGQIAFPGGGADPGDADRRHTALRETREEVGLPPEAVEIAGRLDTYVTRTGFEVVPFVGLLRPPLALNPDPFEVADTFELPLSFVLRGDQPARHSAVLAGRERQFWVFPWRDRYVWGATAGILRNLREILLREVDG